MSSSVCVVKVISTLLCVSLFWVCHHSKHVNDTKIYVLVPASFSFEEKSIPVYEIHDVDSF